MPRALRHALLLMLACCLVARADDKAGTQKTTAELKAALEQVLRETHTPGLAVAIVSRDKVEWVAGIGMADVAAHAPATEKTLFRIGSISKGFTALAILKLQEEGRLNIDDPYSKWAPEIPIANPWDSTDPVRLVHLLEHTSGLPDMHLSEYARDAGSPVTLREALAFAPGNRVCRWRPGSRMAYCNVGPALLAYVVEKVSGQRFEDYVHDHLFVPMGMKTATYFPPEGAGLALSRAYYLDGVRTYPYWNILYRPAGAVNASAKDMAAYLRFYLNRGSAGGRALLRPASIERMEVPKTLPAAHVAPVAGYGLYNYSSFEKGYEFHGHNGGMMGALAEMAYCPDLGVGYAVMISTANGGTLWRACQLVKKYLVRDAQPAALPAPHELSDALKRRYSGYYKLTTPRQAGPLSMGEVISTLKLVSFGKNGLSLLPVLGGWPQSYVAVTDNVFRLKDAPKATLVFLEDADGRPLLQFDGGTMRPTSGTLIWSTVALSLVSMLLMASSLGFAPVWIVRRLIGRLPTPGPLAVRTWPLVGSLLFVVLIALLSAGPVTANVAALGTVNGYSVGIMLTTLAFPLAALLSAIAAWRHRLAPMNRVAYWHSVAVTAGLAFLSGVAAYWGIVGVRTWA